MRTLKAALVFTCILSGAGVVRVQEPPAQATKADKFSPLGFDALRAFEQAYPADVGSPVVIQANTGKYWAFRGVAYPGTTPAVNGVWTSLGPETLLENPNQIQKTVSGRVSALLISPRCGLRGGGCRLWVGTAGGGVWRTDDAMNTVDPRWKWISRGLGTNNIGGLALDPN